jgi:AraC-like DNA-binding protein
MFYLDPDQILAMAQGLDPALKELPFVPAGAVWDPDLAARVAGLHRMYEDPAGDPLTRQSRLGLLIQDVFTRYGRHCPDQVSRSGRTEMERVRQYLEEAFDTPVRLADLAALTGMNPFRLVRGFTQAWGLPPHAFLVQVRVRRVATMLRQGIPPGQAAVEAGFADQSHLNRHFLLRFGVTPGVYAKAFLPPGSKGREMKSSSQWRRDWGDPAERIQTNNTAPKPRLLRAP